MSVCEMKVLSSVSSHEQPETKNVQEIQNTFRETNCSFVQEIPSVIPFESIKTVQDSDKNFDLDYIIQENIDSEEEDGDAKLTSQFYSNDKLKREYLIKTETEYERGQTKQIDNLERGPLLEKSVKLKEEKNGACEFLPGTNMHENELNDGTCINTLGENGKINCGNSFSPHYTGTVSVEEYITETDLDSHEIVVKAEYADKFLDSKSNEENKDVLKKEYIPWYDETQMEGQTKFDLTKASVGNIIPLIKEENIQSETVSNKLSDVIETPLCPTEREHISNKTKKNQNTLPNFEELFDNRDAMHLSPAVGQKSSKIKKQNLHVIQNSKQTASQNLSLNTDNGRLMFIPTGTGGLLVNVKGYKTILNGLKRKTDSINNIQKQEYSHMDKKKFLQVPSNQTIVDGLKIKTPPNRNKLVTSFQTSRQGSNEKSPTSSQEPYNAIVCSQKLNSVSGNLISNTSGVSGITHPKTHPSYVHAASSLLTRKEINCDTTTSQEVNMDDCFRTDNISDIQIQEYYHMDEKKFLQDPSIQINEHKKNSNVNSTVCEALVGNIFVTSSTSNDINKGGTSQQNIGPRSMLPNLCKICNAGFRLKIGLVKHMQHYHAAKDCFNDKSTIYSNHQDRGKARIGQVASEEDPGEMDETNYVQCQYCGSYGLLKDFDASDFCSDHCMMNFIKAVQNNKPTPKDKQTAPEAPVVETSRCMQYHKELPIAKSPNMCCDKRNRRKRKYPCIEILEQHEESTVKRPLILKPHLPKTAETEKTQSNPRIKYIQKIFGMVKCEQCDQFGLYDAFYSKRSGLCSRNCARMYVKSAKNKKESEEVREKEAKRQIQQENTVEYSFELNLTEDGQGTFKEMNTETSKHEKGYYKGYDDDTFRNAILLVKAKKLTQGQAARKFGIPQSTISNFCRGKYKLGSEQKTVNKDAVINGVNESEVVCPKALESASDSNVGHDPPKICDIDEEEIHIERILTNDAFQLGATTVTGQPDKTKKICEYCFTSMNRKLPLLKHLSLKKMFANKRQKEIDHLWKCFTSGCFVILEDIIINRKKNKAFRRIGNTFKVC